MKTVRSNSVAAVLLLMLPLTLISCKYKDGPAISFRSADVRVIGNYKAEVFTIDGTDAISQWNDSVCNVQFSLYHETDPVERRWVSVRHDDAYLTGAYSLKEKNTILYLYQLQESTGYAGYGPFRAGKDSSWDLLKLRKDEMWMQTEFEGHIYYVELKQI